tara:strand:+ start:345 stop:722 length:378 start_codon:yes stop_codon:yes gene_type:complete
MKLQLYTYPKGPASTLPQEEVVSVMNQWGRFNELRIGMLDEGDRYTMPIQTELGPRSDTQLLAALAHGKLTPLYVDNIIDKTERTFFLLNDERDELFKYEYKKEDCTDLDALRDGLNYILDQEEL